MKLWCCSNERSLSIFFLIWHVLKILISRSTLHDQRSWSSSHYHGLFSTKVSTMVFISVPWSLSQYHGLCLSTMIFVSVPWSSSQYHGLCLSTMVFVSVPWSSSQYHGLRLSTFVSVPWSLSQYHDLHLNPSKSEAICICQPKIQPWPNQYNLCLLLVLMSNFNHQWRIRCSPWLPNLIWYLK